MACFSHLYEKSLPVCDGLPELDDQDLCKADQSYRPVTKTDIYNAVTRYVGYHVKENQLANGQHASYRQAP